MKIVWNLSYVKQFFLLEIVRFYPKIHTPTPHKLKKTKQNSCTYVMEVLSFLTKTKNYMEIGNM